LVRGAEAPAPAAKEAPTETREEQPPDDLTVIRGIGVAIQDRLNAAGIRSYDQLARATPEELRSILGRLARAAKLEEWIAQARELAEKE
jgi:predicted flap endonuclease-1-like 5' DNA nuclease